MSLGNGNGNGSTITNGINAFLTPILLTVIGILIWHAFTDMGAKIDVANDRLNAQASRLAGIEVTIGNQRDGLTQLEGRVNNLFSGRLNTTNSPFGPSQPSNVR